MKDLEDATNSRNKIRVISKRRSAPRNPHGGVLGVFKGWCQTTFI